MSEVKEKEIGNETIYKMVDSIQLACCKIEDETKGLLDLTLGDGKARKAMVILSDVNKKLWELANTLA